jgi:hypothetical protein
MCGGYNITIARPYPFWFNMPCQLCVHFALTVLGTMHPTDHKPGPNLYRNQNIRRGKQERRRRDQSEQRRNGGGTPASVKKKTTDRIAQRERKAQRVRQAQRAHKAQREAQAAQAAISTDAAPAEEAHASETEVSPKSPWHLMGLGELKFFFTLSCPTGSSM